MPFTCSSMFDEIFFLHFLVDKKDEVDKRSEMLVHMIAEFIHTSSSPTIHSLRK